MTAGETRRFIVQFTEPLTSYGLLESTEDVEEEPIGPADKHLYILELDKAGYTQLLNDSRVLSIQPDGISYMLGIPNDPNYDDQWNLAKVNMQDAWDIETGNSDVVVAVIDTGADEHPDLTSSIVNPYDAVNQSGSFPNYASDGNNPAWHGTFVSGIIAAQTGNGLGIAGMAPGVSIMPINVFEWDDNEDDYIAWDSSVIDAIYHAIDHGADVINMSFGGSNSNPTVLQAISDARAAGIVVIAAAGNSSNEVPVYPASYAGVISVSATDQNDQKASFSSFGGTVDLSAPGVDIRSLSLSGYMTGEGTSFSAPLVSGLAALLKSCDASLTPDQVESIMESTAVDLGSPGFDHEYGEGRIDAYAALSYMSIHPSVRLIASASSPQTALSSILLTASIENSEQYEYYFESKRDDGDWTILRDWDTDNTYSWLPSVYGSYNLRVSVRPIGESLTSRAALLFTINAPPWVSRGDDALTISAGEPIDGELTEMGDQDMYRFTVPRDGTYIICTSGDTDTYGALFDSEGALISENDNDADANFRIVSEMTEGSVYYIGVRHAGVGTGLYSLSAERQAIPVEGVSLQADTGTSAEFKSEVRLTAQITSGDKGNALYRFEAKKAGGKWQTIRDFAPENECIWEPPSIGTYDIRVFARNSVQVNDATDQITAFTATDIAKQTKVTLTVDSESPEYNHRIELTATPEGENASRAEFRYIYKYSSKWYVIEEWTDSPTCEWYPPKRGTYTFRVYTRTKGRTNSYDTYADFKSTYTDIPKQTSVTLMPDKPPIQEVGTTITLTAKATEGNTALSNRAMYQFQAKLGKTWTVIRDWEKDSSYDWIPTAMGTYTLRVYTKTEGRSSYDTYKDYKYTVDIEPLSAVFLTVDASTPQAVNSAITLNAEAEGRHADFAEYLFRVKEGSKWKTLRAWNSDPTCTWTPTKQNRYVLEVQARAAGRGGYDTSYQIENYFIFTGNTPLESLGVTTSKEAPQEIKQDIKITAQAYGEKADGTELYQIRVKKGSKWTTLSKWGINHEVNWQPTAPGTYTIEVQARAADRSGYDVIYSEIYTVIDIPKQQGVALTTDVTEGQEYGTDVTLTATPAEGEASGRAEYRFRYKYGSKWSYIGDWSDSNTCTWQPPKKGAYTFRVYTRTKGRTNSYDTYADIKCTFADIPKQAGINLIVDKDPIQEARTEINLTAVNTTEDSLLADRAQYKFTYKLGKKETVIQDWSKEATCTWIPEAKGTYTLYVYTHTEGRSGNDASAVYKNYVIDVTPLTNVTVTAAQQSPQPAGTEITLTAEAEGLHADNALYLFRVKDGSKWRTLQNWSDSAACTWTPKSEYMCTVEVQARAAGRSGTDVTGTIENYFVYTGKLPVAGLDVTIPEECVSPQEIKQDITINAQATGESADGTEEYQLRVKLGSKWTVLSPWSTAKDFTWQPSKPGTYTIEVQTRAAGRKGYDAIHTETYIVTDIPKQQGVELANSMTEPQEFSNPITLTATPLGEETLTNRAEYRFLYKLGTKWTEIRNWDKSNTIEDWTPTKAGTYTVRVEIKTEGRSSRDAYADIKCVILDIPKQSGVNLTVDPQPVQEPGTTIKLTAETTTADPVVAARAEYQFQVKQGSTWTILKDWHDENPWEEPGNTWRWTPEIAGTYYLRAYVRTNGRLDYDKYKEFKYVVDTIPLSGLTIAGDPVGPVEPETKITITATAEGVHADKAEYRFSFHNGTQWYVKGWSDNNVFTEKPSHNATYKFKVEARVKGRSGVDQSRTLTYRVGAYVRYTYTASNMAQIQYQRGGAVKSSGANWVPASQSDILYYVNPQNWLDGADKYQFLSLNYISGISASDLNAIISDNSQNGGVLKGKGSVFLSAAKQYDINPAYLVSHAMLETGNGTSLLAKGIVVNGTKVYNMYGICAYDSNPNKYGSEHAYSQGWTSVDKAITGGASWISTNYINRSSGEQNTLYSMRWNPNYIQGQYNAGKQTSQISPSHQYATDVAWAVKQVGRLKSLMDRCVGAVLEFIIPDYK